MYKLVTIFLILVFTITAQDKNQITIDSKSGKPMLVGLCDRDAFVDTNFSWWFNSGYKFYYPADSVITLLSDIKLDYSIKIIMGTWCSDSRREVPRFYKLLDGLKFPETKVTLINVDRKKKGLDATVDDLNILLVPTFIIYNGSKEIGRIIETPITSLENDLLQILTKTSIDK